MGAFNEPPRSWGGAVTVPQTDPPVVIGRHVTRTYPAHGSQVTAVHDASWVLGQGMRVALIGPSGSGKSTLLYLLAGLDNPTSGSIAWPALSSDPGVRRQRIGVVFQGASLVPTLDVTENIALPILFTGVASAAATRRAQEVAAQLDIDNVKDKLPQEISGGQAQRVAIARALAAQPALILADEPTGQLDHNSARSVIDVLVTVSLATGAALIVATHDPLIANRLSHSWTMRDGRLDTGSSATPAAT
jgi:ABC-type lipoprotein export system ATPase subunit